MTRETAQRSPTRSALAALLFFAQGCADVTVVPCAAHDASAPGDAAPDAAPEDGREPPRDGGADVAEPPPPTECVQLPHCRTGYFCPPEIETTPVERDATPAPPVLSEVVATRHGDAVYVSAVGADPNGDVGPLTIEATDEYGNATTPYATVRGDHYAQGVRFRRTMSLRGLAIWRVRATVTDLAGNRAVRAVAVVPQPVLGEGAECDFLGALNRCFAGGACRPVVNEGAPRCVRSTPPQVLSAEILYNAVDGRAEMRIALREIDHGQVFFSLQAFDATGARRPEFEALPEVTIGAPRLRPADRAVCDSAMRWSLSGPFNARNADLRANPPSAMRLVARLRDEEGMVTEVREFTVRPTPTVGHGEPCDEGWVEQRCDRAAGLACVSANCGGAPGCPPFRCRPPSQSCPAIAGLIDLNAAPVPGAVDTWRAEGEVAEGRTFGQVACVFGESFRDRPHRFRAPRAGRWRFTATAREGAVQLGAVASCGDSTWGNVHFCTGGEATATQDYSLRAGEEVVVAVARSPVEVDRAYALTVRPAP